MYQVVMNSTRLGTYYSLKKRLDLENRGRVTLVAAGALAGALGGLVSNPFSVIKIRVQGSRESLSSISAGQSLLREEGWQGLALGWKAVILRVATGSAVQLSTYDICKDSLSARYPDLSSLIVQFSASAMTGVLVVLAMNPFDVATTRMQNQREPGTYRSPLDCLAKTVEREGPLAVYKGFFPNLLRIGPHTVLTFLFLEQIKKRV